MSKSLNSTLVAGWGLPNDGRVQFSGVKVAAVEGGGQTTFTPHSQTGAHSLFIYTREVEHAIRSLFCFCCVTFTLAHTCSDVPYGTSRLIRMVTPATMRAPHCDGRRPMKLIDTVMRTLAGMSTAPKITWIK